MRRQSVGATESGSILDATDTPRRDLLRYAGAYPLAVTAAGLSIASWSWDTVLVGVGGVAVAMVAGLFLTAWVTRTGDVGSAASGPVVDGEAAYDANHELTESARQRLRILLFGVGMAVWGGVALVGFLWVAFNLEVVPLQ